MSNETSYVRKFEAKSNLLQSAMFDITGASFSERIAYALFCSSFLVIVCQLIVLLLCPFFSRPTLTSSSSPQGFTALSSTPNTENSHQTDSHGSMNETTRPQSQPLFNLFQHFYKRNFFKTSPARLGSLIEIFFLSLAASTLVCDAIFHLIPESFQCAIREALKASESRTPIDITHKFFGVGQLLYLNTCCLTGMISVFIVETIVHSEGSIKWCLLHISNFLSFLKQQCLSVFRSPNTTSLSSIHTEEVVELPALENTLTFDGSNPQTELTFTPLEDLRDVTHHHSHHRGSCCNHGFSHLLVSQESDDNLQLSKSASKLPTIKSNRSQHTSAKKKNAAAVANLVAELLHNIVDGMAIGVAFSSGSLLVGLASTIAIFAHEVPSQIADFILLLRANYNITLAFWLNFIVALGIHIGVIAAMFGAPTGSHSGLQMVAAGNFICLGLAIILPQMREAVSEANRAPSRSVDIHSFDKSNITVLNLNKVSILDLPYAPITGAAIGIIIGVVLIVGLAIIDTSTILDAV